jgi:hypothetical protein
MAVLLLPTSAVGTRRKRGLYHHQDKFYQVIKILTLSATDDQVCWGVDPYLRISNTFLLLEGEGE